MNQRTVKKVIVYLSSAAVLMCSLVIRAEAGSPEQVIKRYEVALNASDTTSIMKLYGEHPVFMPQHSPAQSGRSAVKKAYDSVFKTIDLNITFTVYEVEVHGKTAWARTSSAGKTILLANGKKIDEGNNELFIFKKEKGEWKIHRYLFSTTTPR
ncbi:Ketosteroid isomerase homolog [hydrothermal vent metagenome]|uniref:Ketosteroid isomerase homolog n=1 Tax=hydrothermal vent metagenome TaxID=652676 RepID=A0A3B0XE01_9ZZZZ